MISLQALSPYLSKSWSPVGNGPQEYNCWNFMRLILKNEFGVTVPLCQIGDAEACRAMFSDGLGEGWWKALPVPEHGAGVLLRGGDYPHVGIYLETIDGPRILHAMEGAGIVFQSVARTKMLGFARLKYYRFGRCDAEQPNSPGNTPQYV